MPEGEKIREVETGQHAEETKHFTDELAIFIAKKIIFSRGHATLHLAVSVGRSVRPSVRPSVTFLNSERFSHYCSCPTVRLVLSDATSSRLQFPLLLFKPLITASAVFF